MTVSLNSNAKSKVSIYIMNKKLNDRIEYKFINIIIEYRKLKY